MLHWFHSNLRRAVMCTPLMFHSPWSMAWTAKPSKSVHQPQMLISNSSKHWTPKITTKQLNQKQVKYPTSHFSPFNCSSNVALYLQLKKGATLKIYKLHIVLGRSVKKNKEVVNC